MIPCEICQQFCHTVVQAESSLMPLISDPTMQSTVLDQRYGLLVLRQTSFDIVQACIFKDEELPFLVENATHSNKEVEESQDADPLLGRRFLWIIIGWVCRVSLRFILRSLLPERVRVGHTDSASLRASNTN